MISLWKWFRDQLTRIWVELFSAPPKDSPEREVTMNIKWNRIAGEWTRFHSKVKERWSELTDHDLLEVNGHFEVLVKKIQERYGVERAEAKQQIDLWTANLRV